MSEYNDLLITAPTNDTLIPDGFMTVSEYLTTNYLAPYKITPDKLSIATGIVKDDVVAIVNGKQPITADTAVRMGKYLGVNPMIWLMLQANDDVKLSQKNLSNELNEIEPLIDTDSLEIDTNNNYLHPW